VSNHSGVSTNPPDNGYKQNGEGTSSSKELRQSRKSRNGLDTPPACSLPDAGGGGGKYNNADGGGGKYNNTNGGGDKYADVSVRGVKSMPVKQSNDKKSLNTSYGSNRSNLRKDISDSGDLGNSCLNVSGSADLGNSWVNATGSADLDNSFDSVSGFEKAEKSWHNVSGSTDLDNSFLDMSGASDLDMSWHDISGSADLGDSWHRSNGGIFADHLLPTMYDKPVLKTVRSQSKIPLVSDDGTGSESYPTEVGGYLVIIVLRL